MELSVEDVKKYIREYKDKCGHIDVLKDAIYQYIREYKDKCGHIDVIKDAIYQYITFAQIDLSD